MGQAGLGEFGTTEQRPEEEAIAIADKTGSADIETVDGLPEADGTTTVAVAQVDYTLEFIDGQERPIIHVFGRDPDSNAATHIRVKGFRPYFYVPTDSIDISRFEEHDQIIDWDEGYISIREKPVTRVYARTPRVVGNIRDEFDHFEADIRFPNRFLIDNDITSGIRVPTRELDDGTLEVAASEVEAVDATADFRTLTFDIEVDDRSGFPEDGEEPIISLVTHDSFEDEYSAWLFEAPDATTPSPSDLTNHDPFDDDAALTLRVFDSEAAMLEAFLEYVEEFNFDVITGWNADDFDIPYLLDRLERLNGPDLALDNERLSRVGEIWRSEWGAPSVKGRVVFDLLDAYKATQFTELESYRLDAVAEMELGVGKERYPGDIGDLWENDPERLLEYNLRDVELCVELDRKQGIIAFWQEVADFVGCNLEDATTAGDVVDMYVLHKVHGEFVLPSKGQVESEEFEGGAVFDPITGVAENVTVLDLKCFSGDTEVLTPEGARNIQDISVGDKVFSLNTETFDCEISTVAETHSYDNKLGELHHLSGNTHDFKITENHRMIASKTRGWDDLTPDDFEIEEYREFTDTERYAFPSHHPTDGKTPDSFSLLPTVENGYVVVYYDEDLRKFRHRMPEAVKEHLDLAHGSSEIAGYQKKVGKYLIPVDIFEEHRETIETHADQLYLKYDRSHRETPFSFSMEDWLELLGWFITEGSIDEKNNRFTLHQSNAAGRTAIQDLLTRMEINYNVGDRGINISNKYLLNILMESCGKGYANKQIPDWVFELDGQLLRILLKTIIEGDGSTTESGLYKFWTKSDQLKEDMLQLAVHCGKKPTVSKQSDETWYLSIGKRGSFMKSTNATVEEHTGEVYCLTTEDNHVILAGRNGHFQWIGQSLYPMCMVTINASPETKVEGAEDQPTFQAPNGTKFRKEPDGIIREMVDELLSEREEKKSLRNEHDPDSEAYAKFDRQQGAVKVLMNSLYGVLGWDRFRLYDKEMGAAVTATGREVIKFTEAAANERDKEVIYGDTDSVMLSLGEDITKEAAIEESFELEEYLNDRYDEFARDRLNADNHRFQIEFEKLYRRFFQAGKKKRYAGHIIWKEGKDVDDIEITGFEYKRSDIAPITKEVQKQVIEMIVTGEDLEDIKSYLHDVIEDFRDGNVSLDDVAIPGGIGKRLNNYDTDTAHVRGAKYANLLLGTNFARGSKPKRLYLKKVHPDYFDRLEADLDLDVRKHPKYAAFKSDPDVICFEYADQVPPEFQVDWDKMLEKTLKGPIARILEALDVSWEEVKAGQTQQGLGSFM